MSSQSPSLAVTTQFPSARRTSNIARRVRQMRRLAHWMDSAFRIPGTQRRIGLDSLLGLVPGLGDLATSGVSAAIILQAMRMGIPKPIILRMLLNVGVDAAVGTIPVLGDLFDVAFKANVKNVDLLEEHLGLKK